MPEKKWTDERLDDLNTKVDVGFARVDKKLDDLDKKVDSKIDKLDAKFDKKLGALDAKFDKKFDRLTWVLVGAIVSIIAAIIGPGPL